MFGHDNEGVIIEFVVRESSGAKIESYRVRVNDANKTKSVLYILKKKYGLNDFSKSDRDIDWLKQGNKW